MSLNRYAAMTDINQAEIVNALLRVGCSVYYIRKPVDILCGYRGRNVLLEIKRPKAKGQARGKKTEAQEKFFQTWRGQVLEVSTVDEALKAVGVKQ